MLTFVVVESRWAERGGCRAALEVSVDFQSSELCVVESGGRGCVVGWRLVERA